MSFDTDSSSTGKNTSREFSEIAISNTFINKYINVIKRIIKQNKNKNNIYEGKRYILKKEPELNIKSYSKRIVKFLNINENILISSLIILDRLLLKNVTLTKHNVHKLLLISIVTCMKQLDDSFISNKDIAKTGCISLDEFLNLEYEFLSDLNFEVFIHEEEFNSYKDCLVNTIN